jgi:hypothetical protein
MHRVGGVGDYQPIAMSQQRQSLVKNLLQISGPNTRRRRKGQGQSNDSDEKHNAALLGEGKTRGLGHAEKRRGLSTILPDTSGWMNL